MASPPATAPVDFGAAVEAEARRRGLGRARHVYRQKPFVRFTAMRVVVKRESTTTCKGTAVIGSIDLSTGMRRSVEVPRIFGFASGY
ncbi:MAG: hypothetical protein Q7S40_32800 [Opitutaceae bacterium]|nr:hypothetical protein [Opitutaceae bacterium]